VLKKVTKDDLHYTPVPLFECVYCVRDIQAQMAAFRETQMKVLNLINKRMIRRIKEEKERAKREIEQIEKWGKDEANNF